MLRTKFHRDGDPVLASVSDLDGVRVADISIGLPDGPGGRFRVLQRMRGTPREGVKLASRTACVLAGASSETVLDPQNQPAAIRISDGPEGACIWLDYDVGVVDEGRPRQSRPLRLVMMTRKGGT